MEFDLVGAEEGFKPTHIHRETGLELRFKRMAAEGVAVFHTAQLIKYPKGIFNQAKIVNMQNVEDVI